MSDSKSGARGEAGDELGETERMREVEQELRRLRLLVDRSRDALMLHDVRGRLLEVNRFGHDSLGYSREEFLRLSIGDVNPDVGSIPKERLGEQWRKMPLDSSVTVETNLVRKDGHEIPMEVVVAPFEEQGQRLFAAICRDVSERKAAEAARRREELRFQAVFEGAPTGLVLINAQGTIMAANPALEQMLGARSGGLIGRTLDDITLEADLEIGRSELEQLRRGEREFVRVEKRYAGCSGKILWAQLSAFRYGDPKTDEVRTVAFIEDINERKQIETQRREMFERLDELVAQRTAALEQEIAERKRTEQELNKAMRAAEAANLAKSQFLASMSHELRTPLNAVIGYSEMLMEEAEDTGSEDLVPDLQRIRNAGKHLLGIINDILDLSKVEAGKIELFIESVQLSALIDEIIDTVRPLAQNNGNELSLSLELGAGIITTDITRVRQVLFNLLSNACKFTEQGRVSLRVQELRVGTEGWLRLDVSDSGVGIKPEQLSKLFKPFTQADASTSRRFGGTGLGLSISDQFAQMLGGRIEVESEYGVGSTFTLWLPTHHAQQQAASASGTFRAVTGHNIGTVLVVDDESESRGMLARLLEAEGYAVLTAPTGARAMQLAELHKPDVITLDVMMPGMDGWAVLSRLKQRPEFADIPVVIVSLMPDADMGYALGAADVLAKPIEIDRLRGVLSRFGPNAGSHHVLVVDDDPEARDLLCRAVLKEGWDVQQAINGARALESIRASRPKLVLLDLMMPEMDGFELLEILRADPSLASLPVIVVTAKQLGGGERDQLAQRVSSIMQKGSYSRSELVQHIRSLVDLSIAKS
ncbi:response regulator [Enhygromyxa salina]|uniref:histidine kinase n=1 Tax=Enhygromyxa salina TaxID=215803 RepID=A0A2S9YLV9_9BACT|nr:response regulator [Enhygromyxa salina]PRQ06032.1 Autoinducer 2 sensor kinase/phosphatase LuxQ [Enhygromyxa salina]